MTIALNLLQIKSLRDYRIIYGLAEYNFYGDDKQSDGFIRRDAAKKIGLKSVIGIPLIYNDEAIGVLKIGTKKVLII
jgi:hypothetical protein